MGKLRIEPKAKRMSSERFSEIQEVLEAAVNAADAAHVFYDLDEHEDGAKTRKELLEVAESLGLNITVRTLRNQRTLALAVSGGVVLKRGRITSDKAKQKILDVLSASGKPMRKSEIIAAAGINPGTWNPRISELLKEGRVSREGLRRDSVYCLV